MAGYEDDISTQLISMGCSICGRPLRDPNSIERGWGPDCDANYMFGTGTDRVSAQVEHLFDEEAAAEAIRSAPTVVPTRFVEPVRVAAKGDVATDGTVLKGGEILESRQLNIPGLREYWERKGGGADDPRAKWRHSPEVRREMVSNGVWYASRAVTFGYDEDVISAEKVDPKWLVLAAVQRFARAVGMPTVADRMTNFYGAKMRKFTEVRLKAADKRDTIIFEHSVPASHVTFRSAVGPGVSRLHAPYNVQWNELVRSNRETFFAFEKDPPYFWRYYRDGDVRRVVNMVQECFGDALSITRPAELAGDRMAKQRRRQNQAPIVDVWTGEVRWIPKSLLPNFADSARFLPLKGAR